MKVAELKKAAKEVKTELGFEEIDLKGDVKAQLIEVAGLIGADGEDAIEEDELNDLSKETKALLLELRSSGADDSEEAEEEKPVKKAKAKKKAKKEVEPEPEEEETEDDEDIDILEEVKNADLDGLKALIKEQGKEVFPIASRGLPLQKNADKLRVKALKDLGEEVEEETAPVKEEKPVKEKKAPKKEKASKENGTYLTRLWTVKNPKLTPDEVFDKLQKKGVTMSLVSVKLRQNEVLSVLKIQAELKK